jgi:DNA-binding MarR family transcriptional regulator
MTNPPTAAVASWTFLDNHAHVLICIARSPELRLRDIAEQVGITERAVQRIVTELEQSGYLTRVRAGRRNQYLIHSSQRLRHALESHCTVHDLLDLILSPEEMRLLDATTAELLRALKNG